MLAGDDAKDIELVRAWVREALPTRMLSARVRWLGEVTPGLSGTAAALLWFVVVELCDNEGAHEVSRRAQAAHLGRSESSVSRAYRELGDAGLVRWIHRKGSTDVTMVELPMDCV